MASRHHRSLLASLALCLRHRTAGPSLHVALNHHFSTTTPAQKHRPKGPDRQRRDYAHQLPSYVAAPTLPPPYPYEAQQKLYRQSETGLYGGVRKKFGRNQRGEFTPKTPRVWKPNIVRKRLYSVALRRRLQLRVATRALRTIDKAGGLDEYLLGHKPARLKELGPEGWRLRWAVLQALKDSPRVLADPRLRFELANGMPREDAAVLGSAVEVELQESEGQEEDVEEAGELSQEQYEEAVAANAAELARVQSEGRTLGRAEGEFMGDEQAPPPPQSLGERLGSWFRRR